MQLTQSSPSRFRLIAGALLAVLVVLMVLNTKFLTPAEVAAIAPKVFDPVQSAADVWGRAQTELGPKAAPAGEVVPAFQSDVKGAAAKYNAVSPNENAYFFPVTAEGTVVEASSTALRLQVPGIPAETPVLVPLSTGLNGTVVRDAMGFKFADAPGQTDYQYVGDELKKLIQAEIAADVADPAALEGKKVDVVGVVSVLSPSGAPPPEAKPVNVQPLSVKAAS